MTLNDIIKNLYDKGYNDGTLAMQFIGALIFGGSIALATYTPNLLWITILGVYLVLASDIEAAKCRQLNEQKEINKKLNLINSKLNFLIHIDKEEDD